MNIREIVALAPVIPWLDIDEIEHAVPLARALSAGGLRVMEVNLRTPAALASIGLIRKAVPAAIVGVGFLTRAVDFAAADRAGAQFGTTPGLAPELSAAARGARFPLMPGVATPSEVIAARHAGFNVVRFFPAGGAAGVGALQALHAPFPDVVFCPGGDVTRQTAPHFLALPNVVCVSGAWLAPRSMLAAGDWAGIEALARDGASTRSRA